MNDTDKLLKLVADKDQQAFEQLYSETSPKLLSFIMRLVNQDQATAEDILQDVFIKIWDKADRYNKTKGSSLAWMATVARNQTYDYFRRAKSRPELVEEGEYEGLEYSSKESEPDSISEQAEQIAIFKSLVNDLPNVQQQALMQSLVYGYSHSEIATKLNVPLGTVKAWLRRNIAVFQSRMSKQTCLNLSLGHGLMQA